MDRGDCASFDVGLQTGRVEPAIAIAGSSRRRRSRRVMLMVTENARRAAVMIAIHGPRDGRVLRAELWLCSPVWCALRMGHGPELVSDAAAAGC